MTPPLITALTAAVLLFLQLALMLSVGLHRTRLRVGVGSGDDPHLERKIRRHGNLTENAGLFVIGLGLLELLGGSATAVIILAAVFVIGRLAHAVGFSSLVGSHLEAGSALFPSLRAMGAFTTLAAGIGVAVYLIYTVMS